MQQETCTECGIPLENQDNKRRGGRERRYFSDHCRQAAYRREKAARRKEERRQPGAQTHWFDKKIALEVLRYRFQLGKEIIRIATGFFTVRGYNLLRAAARGKRMYILVGLDDPGEKRVRKALTQEIMLDLRTGVDIDRRSAVLELVEKLKGGNFQIVDARAMQHHAKLYIVDMVVAMIGNVVIARALRQIEETRGAMVVASTGLGKTITRNGYRTSIA